MLMGMVYFVVASDVVVGLAGVTTAIGTGATLGQEVPPVGWRSASWGVGGANIVSSAVFFGIAGASEDVMPWTAIGLAHLAVTATNFALAGVAMSRADEVTGSTSAALRSAPAATLPVFSWGGAF